MQAKNSNNKNGIMGSMFNGDNKGLKKIVKNAKNVMPLEITVIDEEEDEKKPYKH